MMACRLIAERAKVPVHFEFLTGFANGLTREQVRRFIHSYIPGATVHGHQPYAQYMARIAQCDMVLNPFPYGNMNGISDMAHLGLAGVCRTGPQVHEHIDGGIFKRLGLPGWLVAENDGAYIAAALRLAENHGERLALRRALLERGGDEVLMHGRPEILAGRLAALLESGADSQV
jgi:predicted O-linked N-acetylglucosamine transferase (SPINDLY family)